MHTDLTLIPRTVLFGNPDRAMARISPDGAHLAWLAPRDGVLNVWVAPREDVGAARPVTQDVGRGIRMYMWAFTGSHILYLQDKDGDENWRLYSVDIESNEVRELTPIEGVLARLVNASRKLPDEVVVGLNDRDPSWHDIYRINIITGERKLLLRNDRFQSVIVDDDYRLRIADLVTDDGGAEFYIFTGGDFQLWDTVGPEDLMTTAIIGFDATDRFVYREDSRGRNTAALFEVDLETMQSRLLAEDARADAAEVICHPTEKNVQAVSFVYDRKRWQVVDHSIEPDLTHLSAVSDGELSIVSRTLDDRYWVAAFDVDNGPVRYHLYDREQRSLRFLFSSREILEAQPLVKMHSALIQSRDGLELVAYYSLPLGSDSNEDGVPDKPVPMVLTPHGGPWWRDLWGYSPWHQWLANRGYAVLSVNFRSSTGFGKAFINAGNLEWGGKIMEDQIDAVRWAIDRGIADPKRVAVLGGSFGGYSTLAGLTFTPEVFACGVDLVGPSNLITFIESIPPYWKPSLHMLTTRVGDNGTEEGRERLREHSPLTYAHRISRPLLIAQGANDPRVKQAESDQIVEAMQTKGIPVTYVIYPDEGHGFARPENNLSFYAIAESFLAKCLGGRCEPVGSDFEGSSLTVPIGEDEVPGLPEALATRGTSTQQ